MFASLVVVSLLRWSAGRREDDNLHVLDSDSQLVSIQTVVAHRLDVLDRWRAILVAVVLISGLVLGGFYVYGVWLEGTTTHF